MIMALYISLPITMPMAFLYCFSSYATLADDPAASAKLHLSAGFGVYLYMLRRARRICTSTTHFRMDTFNNHGVAAIAHFDHRVSLTSTSNRISQLTASNRRAGVIGLSNAVFLSEAGYKVTIIAAHVPGNESIEYTSPW